MTFNKVEEKAIQFTEEFSRQHQFIIDALIGPFGDDSCFQFLKYALKVSYMSGHLTGQQDATHEMRMVTEIDKNFSEMNTIDS